MLGLVAASGAALLAVGPRLLDDRMFAGLAIEWTVSTIFGLGVAAPTEQLVNRRLNVDPGSSTRSAAIGIGAAACLAVVLVIALLGWSDLQERFEWLVPGAAVAVVGWSLCAVTRGRLLGAGDLRAYGQSQAVEAAARGALLVAAVVASQAEGILLSAAVGVPLFVAAAWAATHRHPTGAGTVLGRSDGEQLAFLLYALGYQICLNASPLLLAWRVGSTLPALTGAFVVANSYFRAATILTGGVLVKALTDMSLAWGRGDSAAFWRSLHNSTTRAGALAVVSCAAGLVLAPVALPILYGSSLGLSAWTYVALAASTVLVVLTSARATALLAAGRGWWAAAGWMSGAVALVLAATLLPVRSGVTGWALVVAPVVALVFAIGAVRDLRPAG